MKAVMLRLEEDSLRSSCNHIMRFAATDHNYPPCYLMLGAYEKLTRLCTLIFNHPGALG